MSGLKLLQMTVYISVLFSVYGGQVYSKRAKGWTKGDNLNLTSAVSSEVDFP